MQTTRVRHVRGRTVNAAFAAIAGLVFLIACWIGGQPWLGVGCLVLMLVFGGLVLLLSRRSETAAGMFDRGDERWTSIDVKATALAGLVLISAVIVMTMWELGHGRSGQPYAALGALAGVSYLAAFLLLNRRS